VHKVVKEFGPSSTHFDFLQEGAPSTYQPAYIVARIQNYIATMWAHYVDAFGPDDATISVIGKGGGGADRLQHLIDALRSSGRGLPTWFEVHPDWTSPDLFNSLQSFDQTLTANGLLSEPIVVGESSYENPHAARDIARFMQTSPRRVEEVYQWWQKVEGGACFSAPYRGDAYISALTHDPVPPATPSPLPLLPAPVLSAAVSPNGTAILQDQTRASFASLDAGTYTIVVRDRSTRGGFHLSGPDLDLKTGMRFTGMRVWRVELGTADSYGTVFTYRSGQRGTGAKKFAVH
jgi:hypothetical protein